MNLKVHQMDLVTAQVLYATTLKKCTLHPVESYMLCLSFFYRLKKTTVNWEKLIPTDKSRLLVSRLDTARTTPDRHSHSEIFWILSFWGLLTEMKRFPTNSSRYLQAISHPTYPLWVILFQNPENFWQNYPLECLLTQITLRNDTTYNFDISEVIRSPLRQENSSQQGY